GDAAHTSTFGYDTYWRIKSAQAPPDPANSSARAHTDFNYSLANAVPITVNRQKSITNSLMDSFTATFDGVGRTVKTEPPTPAGIATVDTHYDELSQVASVSNPYFSTSDPTYGITQSVYDALGRMTKVIPQDATAKSNYSSTDYSNLPVITVTDQ